MSESEDEYVYSEDEQFDESEEEGTEEEMPDADGAGSTGLSAASSSRTRRDTEGAQGGDMGRSSPSNGTDLTRCADGEVRLLNMNEILPPMASQIATVSDLTGLPPAASAALLRATGWSQEKLLDAFWADRDKLLDEAGVGTWTESEGMSTVGTRVLLPKKRSYSFGGSGGGSGVLGANPQAAGSAEAEDKAIAEGDDGGLALGLPTGYPGIALPRAESAVVCRICFSDVDAADALAAPCGHFFCSECYNDYLVNKLGDGPAVVYTCCPEHKCTTLVPPEIWVRALAGPSAGRALAGVEALGADEVAAAAAAATAATGPVSPTEVAAAAAEQARKFAAHRDRYSQMVLQQFVTSNKQMRWCPSPGCTKIVMAGAGVVNVKCAPCGCNCAFCFRCGEEAHAPSACEELGRWMEKCQNESETANWILANTKRCPKCTTRIEKNQGCNHMTCSQCKYEFCWMCMGNWAEHGAQTGGYYKCNKYDPAVVKPDEDSATKAKRELDRYLHYYKRYQAHGGAQAYASKQLQQTEKRMVELQESSVGSSWIDVQFLKTANEMVIECRRTLKFTYVFGYYMPLPREGESNKHRELFEDLQSNLERMTENLSELTEMPIERMVKADIINHTRVTERFLSNLLQGCEDGLDVVEDGHSHNTAAAAER